MKPLKNARHEAFACAIVKGKAAGAAYVAAGYSKNGADQSASALLRNPNVAARIAELKAKAATGSVATAQQVLEELTKIGLANMQDFVGAQGQLLGVDQLTREHAAAIQEYTVDTYVEGHGEDAQPVKKTKLKLADKRAALVDLGRHHKLFTDKTEHTGKDGGPLAIKQLTDLEAARRIAWLLNSAASAPPEKD